MWLFGVRRGAVPVSTDSLSRASGRPERSDPRILRQAKLDLISSCHLGPCLVRENRVSALVQCLTGLLEFSSTRSSRSRNEYLHVGKIQIRISAAATGDGVISG